MTQTPEMAHVLSAAQWEASRQCCSEVAPAHLLLGLFHPPLTGAGRALLAFGVRPKPGRTLPQEVGDEVWPPPIPLLPLVMPLAPEAARVFRLAEQEAVTRGETELTPAHLVVGLLAAGRGDTRLLLQIHGITLLKARSALFGI